MFPSLFGGGALRAASAVTPLKLYTSGRYLKCADRTVSLQGVNLTELSWSTYGDGSTADGQSDADRSLERALSWNCGVIRLAVNPEFYLYGGTHKDVFRTAQQYQAMVDRFITAITEKDITVILDCHAYYGVTDTVVDFWKTAAPKYDGNDLVMYGLLNEPTGSWEAYYEGGVIDMGGEAVRVKGMPELLDTVRALSDNVAVIGGIDFAFYLTYITEKDLRVFGETREAATGLRAEEYVNKYFLCREDRVGNGIVFDAHIYSTKPSDWTSLFSDVMAEYPLLIGEYGPSDDSGVLTSLTDEQSAYLDRMFDFISGNRLSSTAWGMSAWPFLSLPDGTVTAFGVPVREFIGRSSADLGAGCDGGSAYEGNLLSQHYSAYRPITERIADGMIFESRTFYSQAHRDGISVGSAVVQFITDGDTETLYDIYEWFDYRMGAVFTLDDLLACSEIRLSSGLPGYPDRYKIFVSNSLSTLFNPENCIENLTVEHTGTVSYPIDRQVKYLAFLADGYVRLKEIALFGTVISDADADGRVTAGDLAFMRRVLTGAQSGDGICARLDANLDGRFDLLDLVRTKKRICLNP